MTFRWPRELSGLGPDALRTHLAEMRDLPDDVENRAMLIQAAEDELSTRIALDATYAARAGSS